MDTMLPGVSGYDLLVEMKNDAELRRVPVVVVSPADGLQEVARCIEKGADDYLIKPFDGVLLDARIETCLEKRRQEVGSSQVGDRRGELEEHLQQQVIP